MLHGLMIIEDDLKVKLVKIAPSNWQSENSVKIKAVRRDLHDHMVTPSFNHFPNDFL